MSVAIELTTREKSGQFPVGRITDGKDGSRHLWRINQAVVKGVHSGRLNKAIDLGTVRSLQKYGQLGGQCFFEQNQIVMKVLTVQAKCRIQKRICCKNVKGSDFRADL